jgi:hypothetical protein
MLYLVVLADISASLYSYLNLALCCTTDYRSVSFFGTTTTLPGSNAYNPSMMSASDITRINMRWDFNVGHQSPQ